MEEKTFYTHVHQYGNNILVRGIRNGERIKEKVPYKPYVFIQSKTGNSKYKTLGGKVVDRIDFADINEYKDFHKKYDGIDSMPIHSNGNLVQSYIFDNYPGEIEYDKKLIKIIPLDIETDSKDGYPNIETADKEINAITFKYNGHFHVYGLKDYKSKSKNVHYQKFNDELHLLLKFVDDLSAIEPDVLTGWNIEGFDIPYLVRRITRVIGEEFAKKLSPWGIIREKTLKTNFGKEAKTYELVGIAILDYLALYKKFGLTKRETYRLDFIAEVELKENKLDYSEYGSLANLYEQNFEKYIDYNIHDTELIDRLDAKLTMIDTIFAMSYDAKINYVDGFTSVKLWETIINNHLLERNVVPNVRKFTSVSRELVGGYVKEPFIGMSKWVLSFDLNSLYPHLIRQYNISPETFVSKIGQFLTVDEILEGKIDQLRPLLLENNQTVTANLCLFDRDREGFLPTLMKKMYDDRSTAKKKMIGYKKLYAETKEEKYKNLIASLDAYQMAKKICLNSAYGALGNEYFMYYDINYAEAITMSGQLSIRWIENKINAYLNKLLNTKNKDYVIASDTDSIYVTLEDLVNVTFEGKDVDTKTKIEFLKKVSSLKIEPFIDKCYAELAEYMNAYDQQMHMKLECIADISIWQRKKRYVLNVYHQEGVDYDEPELKIMGLEAIKSSTPQVCRKHIKESIKLIMKGNEENVQKYIDSFRNEFETLPFDQVASPKGVNNIGKYSDAVSIYKSGTPMHVKASIVYNNALKSLNIQNQYELIKDGDKIKHCALIEPNPYRSPVIASLDDMPKEFEIEKYIDYDSQFDKTFLSPIKSILDVIGWTTEEVSSLDSFF